MLAPIPTSATTNSTPPFSAGRPSSATQILRNLSARRVGRARTTEPLSAVAESGRHDGTLRVGVEQPLLSSRSLLKLGFRLDYCLAVSEECSHRETQPVWRRLEKPLSHFLGS